MKRALLAGINQYRTAPLRGCLNDVDTMRDVCAALGFAPPTVLRDDAATGTAIELALRTLLAETKAGDVALFSYSGHGTWVRDLNGDEPDGRDESLVPYDFEFTNRGTWFTDDRLARIVRQSHLPAGALFVVNLDCCNAGTMNRLLGSEDGGEAETRWRTLASPFGEVPRGVVRRMAGLGLRRRPLGARLASAAAGQFLVLTATTATELAADAYIEQKPQGAHTYALARALRATPGASYVDLIVAMRRYLRANGYSQTPSLFGARAPRHLAFTEPLP